MFNKINNLLLTGILILTVSCEVPYDIPAETTETEYVVDGLISDNPGPYIISLSYTANYTHENGGTNLPVLGASLSISDDEGQTEILSPIGIGKYMTSYFFTGIINRTYVLHIMTANGDELMSNPELLPANSPIVGDGYEFLPEDAFHPDGHKVKVLIADNPGQKNYYRWTFSGVFRFITIFDGIIPSSTECWQFEYFPFNIILASDRFVDGNTFEQDITIIPYTSGTPYLLKVYQQSLTKEAYEFWNLVNGQINHSSGIFGVQPARIRGNMFCVNNPDKNVLGYFGASSIIKHPVFVKRASGKVKNLKSYQRNVSCTTYLNTILYNNADPSSWPDGWPR